MELAHGLGSCDEVSCLAGRACAALETPKQLPHSEAIGTFLLNFAHVNELRCCKNNLMTTLYKQATSEKFEGIDRLTQAGCLPIFRQDF